MAKGMGMKKPVLIVATLILILGAVWFYADVDNQAQRMTISDATAVSLQGEEGMLLVTMKLENPGDATSISGVSSSEAGHVHFMGKEGNETIAVPADSKAAFAGDGVHIMMMNVGGKLDEGRLVPITLKAGDGSTLATKARIIKETGMAHAMHGAELPAHLIPKIEGAPPTVALSASANEMGWKIAIAVENFRFAKDLVDGDHVSGTGHGHIYLNGLKLGRLFSDAYQIGSLPNGKHIVRVTLNSNDHRTYMQDGKPITASVEIEAN